MNKGWVTYKLPEKATVYSPDLFVKIYDKDGNIFYEHPNPEGFIKFNLPAGIYKSKNTLRGLSTFEPYNLLDYEGLQSDIPTDWDIYEGDNPNRASVWLKNRKMLVDSNFLNTFKYAPIMPFVVGHELGHYIFNNSDGKHLSTEEMDGMELNCDLFACNKMLQAGYNPSQVLIASMLLLPHTKRPLHLQNFILTLKNRRNGMDE